MVKEWFKAYAVQQLKINSDQIYAKIQYHVVFSAVRRIDLFSNYNFDRFDEIIYQSASPFENTQVHLMCLAPDHIHLYIEASPDYAPGEIIHAVMEYSEQEIAVQFPDRQNIRHALWKRAYFLEGIG